MHHVLLQTQEGILARARSGTCVLKKVVVYFSVIVFILVAQTKQQCQIMFSSPSEATFWTQKYKAQLDTCFLYEQYVAFYETHQFVQCQEIVPKPIVNEGSVEALVPQEEEAPALHQNHDASNNKIIQHFLQERFLMQDGLTNNQRLNQTATFLDDCLAPSLPSNCHISLHDMKQACFQNISSELKRRAFLLEPSEDVVAQQAENPRSNSCAPYPVDLEAIRAVHQQRPATSDNVNTNSSKVLFSDELFEQQESTTVHTEMVLSEAKGSGIEKKQIQISATAKRKKIVKKFVLQPSKLKSSLDKIASIAESIVTLTNERETKREETNNLQDLLQTMNPNLSDDEKQTPASAHIPKPKHKKQNGRTQSAKKLKPSTPRATVVTELDIVPIVTHISDDEDKEERDVDAEEREVLNATPVTDADILQSMMIILICNVKFRG